MRPCDAKRQQGRKPHAYDAGVAKAAGSAAVEEIVSSLVREPSLSLRLLLSLRMLPLLHWIGRGALCFCSCSWLTSCAWHDRVPVWLVGCARLRPVRLAFACLNPGICGLSDHAR